MWLCESYTVDSALLLQWRSVVELVPNHCRISFCFTVIISVCLSVSHIHSHRFFCCLLACFNIVEVSEITNSMLGWPLKLTH